MTTHADRRPENKIQMAGHRVPQRQGGIAAPFQRVNNRPEAVAQRKLRGMIAHSPQAQQAAQLQAMADAYVARRQSLGQHQSHAYAQGAQQEQRPVRPTVQLKADVAIPHTTGLEKDTGVMGQKAMLPHPEVLQMKTKHIGNVVQRTKWKWNAKDKEWSAISDVTSSKPEFEGFYDGQIFNDKVQPPKRVEYGAGNFSFGKSYVENHPSFAKNFTATSYEKKEELKKTYPEQFSEIKSNIKSIEKKGGTVNHNVNATNHNQPTDVTHFNFPHTGDIHKNKTSVMLKDFIDNMENTQQDGHIIRMGVEMSKKSAFDSRYGLRGKINKSSYHPIKKMQFNEERFKDYHHVKTTGKGKFDFENDSRRELWFQKNSNKSNSNNMNAIFDLSDESSYDSDEERELVYNKKRKQSNYVQQNPYDHHMRELLENKPRIKMKVITLTDNTHTGAYRTFPEGAIIQPTGRFENNHIEVKVLSSKSSVLHRGTVLFAKLKHILKVGERL